MALNSLFCADVPLSNYSLTREHKPYFERRALHIYLFRYAKVFSTLLLDWLFFCQKNLFSLINQMCKLVGHSLRVRFNTVYFMDWIGLGLENGQYKQYS